MDTSEFEVIVEQYRQPVFSIIRKMVYCSETANDLAQDTFVRLWLSRAKIQKNRRIFTYVYRIAMNLAIDHLRRQKPESVNISCAEMTTSSSNYEQTEFLNLIYSCSSKLKARQKAVFILRDMEGFSFEELSQILKTPVSNIRSNLHLARKNIRRLLQENYDISQENIYDL